MSHRSPKVSIPSLPRDSAFLSRAPFIPTPSHFRLIALSSLNNRYLDQVHKRMFVPQWVYTEEYERLYSDAAVPYNTEDIAYTLGHLVEKVNDRSGVGYSKVYTPSGREIRTFMDLPDFLSRVVLCTDEDTPPERTSKPEPRFDLHRIVISPLKLPKINIHKAAFFSRSTHNTPRAPLVNSRYTQSPPPRDRYDSRTVLKVRVKHLPKVGSEESIALTGEAVRPALTERGNTLITSIPDRNSELRPETPDQSQLLTSLFSPKEIESLQKEYLHLRHFSILEKVNEAVQSSARLPGNIQEYLSDVRTRGVVKLKFREVFAMYLQGVIPVLKGKSANVFRAVLQGLGSDIQSLSWSQWLLLNSLLIYNNAPEHLQVSFVCRVTSTQMLGSQYNYMDILVLLTSLFQGEGQNQQFQVLFAQLKGVLEAKRLDLNSLEKKCETGELDYRLIMDTLRAH